MSLNPHLGDPGENSNLWQSVSDTTSSSNSQRSFITFGGIPHTFVVFKDDPSKTGASELEDSFSQGKNLSLPALAQEVSDSVSSASSWPHYDPSEVLGKSISLDSGLFPKKNRISKVKDFIKRFFQSSAKTPSFSEWTGSNSLFDQVESPTLWTSVTSEDIKDQNLGAKPKSIKKATSKKLKKSSPTVSKSPSLLTRVFRSGTSRKKPNIVQSNLSPVPFQESDLKQNILSSTSSFSVIQENVFHLEDKLKSIWDSVESKSQLTYDWVGLTLITSSLKKAAKIILPAKERRASLPKVQQLPFLQQQWESLDLSDDNLRSIICAILDVATGATSSFSEALEENEASEVFVDLASRIESELTEEEMKVFLSVITDRYSNVTSNKASSLVKENSLNIELGTAAVRDALPIVQKIQSQDLGRWSTSIQVLTNDIF